MSWGAWLRLAWLLATAYIGQADPVVQPAIDLQQLEQIGVVGRYGGISLYTSTHQLTQLPANTASVLSYVNQTFQGVATSSADGSIYASCLFSPRQIVVGGSFYQFGSVNVSNIAIVDLDTGAVQPLAQGLDGPVYSLYCDSANQAIYVGGAFVAPVSPSPQYADSLAQFGGGVSAWVQGAWKPMPWKGVTGTVNSITKAPSTNVMYFGGIFQETADGQAQQAPASQPIRLSNPAMVSATNTAEGSDPASIICDTAASGTPWLLANDVAGTWQATFTYSVTPSLFRLGNLDMDDRGTRTFGIVALPSGSYFNLTYLDPLTGQRISCTSNCTLAHGTDMTHQDFIVTDTQLAAGFRIVITGWYGTGGGLQSVEAFQRETFVYAVSSLNGLACTTTTDFKLRSQVKRTGTWKSARVSDSYAYALSTSFPASQMGSTDVALQFIPFLPEAGFYHVYFYTPACVTDCTSRTQAQVITTVAPGVTSTTYIDQATSNITSVLVYAGPLMATSTSFQPSVVFKVASNATAPANNTVVLSAQTVQFVKMPSNTTLSSMLQYTPNSDATGLVETYGPLAQGLPVPATVHTIAADDSSVYIGGVFGSTTYSNVARYDTSSQKMAALQANGVNGAVNALLLNGTTLYVGGSFTQTTDSSVTKLAHVAKYDVMSGRWSGLGGGVNGPVYGLFKTTDGQGVLVSGSHSTALEPEATTGNATAGNAWWNATQATWSLNAPYVAGSVRGVYSLQDATTTRDIYTGTIKGAQTYQARGFASVDDNTALSPFAFYPAGQPSLTVSAGAFWKSKTADTVLLAGQFMINNTTQHVALYENGTWAGLRASWEGIANTMDVSNDYLYMGGVTAPNVTSVWIYNLVNHTETPVPDVHTADGSPARVNKMSFVSEKSVVVAAGNFSTAGSLPCGSICLLNPTGFQWNSLGSGLSGDALDFVYTGSQLIVAGTLTLDGTAVPVVAYDYGQNAWRPLVPDSSKDTLPGPSTAVAYDDTTKMTFIAGQSPTGAYLCVWDGQQLTTPAAELEAGSTIRQLVILPLKNAESDLMGNKRAILLATGLLRIDALRNVSSAWFNGTQWTPYLIVSGNNGSENALSSIFFKTEYSGLRGNDFLPVPIVVLVAVAISLGIVFALVLFAFGILAMKRKREAKVDPGSRPSVYYGKPPRRPESLLAVLDSANATGILSTEPKQDTDQPSMHQAKEEINNAPEMVQHSPSNVAAAAAAAATTVQSHSDQTFYASRNVGLDTGAPIAPHQSDSLMYNARNPFRASIVGVFASGDSTPLQTNTTAYASRTVNMPSYTFLNAATTPAADENTATAATASSVRWTNAPPATVGTATVESPAIVQWVNSTDQHTGATAALFSSVTGVVAPPSTATVGGGTGAAATATVAAASMVRWTNAPTIQASSAQTTHITNMHANDSSSVQMCTMPVAPSQTRAMTNTPSLHKWSTTFGDANSGNTTNVVSDQPQCNAAATSQKANMLQVPGTTASSPLHWSSASTSRTVSNEMAKPGSLRSDSFQPETNAASTVRWTNTGTSSMMMDTAVVLPVSVFDTSDTQTHGSAKAIQTHHATHAVPGKATVKHLAPSTYSKATVSYGPGEDIFSTIPRDLLSADLSSDPDIARWTTTTTTTANEPNHGTGPSPLSSSRPVVHSISSVASAEQGVHQVKKMDLERYESGLDIALLPYSGNQPPSDHPSQTMTHESPVTSAKDKDNDTCDSPIIDHDLFKTSSFRWSETPVLPPIETIMTNPFRAQSPDSKDAAGPENPSARWQTTQATSPAGAAPPAAASAQKSTLAPSQRSKEESGKLSPTCNPMDGRAASRRMVEEFFSKRETIPHKETRTFHRDFQVAVEAAKRNNADDLPTTEEHPHLYVAKFDFIARDAGELGFSKNNLIVVVDRSDDIWWMGYKDDPSGPIQGVFPSNYVERAPVV